jgi:hypothetical protein
MEKIIVSNFWDVLWLIASAFFFVAYLIVLFQVVIDLFRDAELGGGSKVIWLIGLIFPADVDRAPLYSCSRQWNGGAGASPCSGPSPIPMPTSGKWRENHPTDQIADAKVLLDAGVINQEEFARLKAKALA